MSDNKVTMDQLDNSAVEAMSSSVGDVSMLNTENKTIVGAISEIVGKKEIANAIGEPLAETDKFTEMSSEINGLLSTFKTNMMNAGVVVESGDKFKALIDKIKGLTEGEGNKGIQYTEGIVKCNTNEAKYFNYIGGNGATASTYVEIPKLNFNPTIIIVSSNEPSNYYPVMSLLSFDYNFNMLSVKSSPYSGGGTDSIANNFKADGLVFLSNSIHIPVYNAGIENYIYTAIGVGEEDTTLRDSLASILEEEGVNVTEEDDMASLIGKVDQEFDRHVVPVGDATVEDVIAGKTFMNNMGELLTGVLVSGLNKIKQGSLETSTPAGKTLVVSEKNIGFKPSIVIIYCGAASSICIAIQDELFSSFPLNGYMCTPTYSIGAGYLNALGTSSGDDYYILNNRFKLEIPVQDRNSATVSWIAIGR